LYGLENAIDQPFVISALRQKLQQLLCRRLCECKKQRTKMPYTVNAYGGGVLQQAKRFTSIQNASVTRDGRWLDSRGHHQIHEIDEGIVGIPALPHRNQGQKRAPLLGVGI
jgi:hypothetical protein